MNRGSTKKQRLEGQQHYDELESDIDEKASERFHTPPAYQSYSVEDYLRKMGVGTYDRIEEALEARKTAEEKYWK